jgi:hypothetical protein
MRLPLAKLVYEEGDPLRTLVLLQAGSLCLLVLIVLLIRRSGKEPDGRR